MNTRKHRKKRETTLSEAHKKTPVFTSFENNSGGVTKTQKKPWREDVFVVIFLYVKKKYY